jgi:PAS domain S-box-containing protein
MTHVCHRCGTILSSEQALQYHLNKKTKCNDLQCSKCKGIFPSKGKLNLHLVHCKDIQKEKYAVYDMLPLADNSVLVEYDTNGFVTYISDTCKTVYGYDRNEIVGTYYNNMIYDGDLIYLKKRQQLFLKNSNTDKETLQFRKIHKDGQMIWIETTFPKKYTDGSGVCTCIETDITKWKEMEEISARGLWEYFIECTVSGKIINMNQETKTMSGIENAEEYNVKDLFKNNEFDITMVGQAKQYCIFKTLFNTEIQVEVGVKKIGKTLGIIFQKYQIDKDDLFRTFVHEIRNPINSLCQGYEYYNECRKSPDSAMCERIDKEMILNQQSCVFLLKNILSDFLDFEKLTTNTFSITEKDTFSLHALIEKVKPVIGAFTYFNEKKVNFVCDKAKVRVQSDEIRLVQIAVNIITNAIKYATTRDIYAYFSIVENDFVMEVVNTGDIHNKELNAIFNPFYRVNMDKNDGTGLGLYICRNIIEKMSGTIKLDNTVENRVKFICKIPVSKEKCKLTDVSMLIVDDFIGIKTTLLILKKKGITDIDLEKSGEGAIEACEKKEYDVILMDKNMSGLSGPETIEVLRKKGNDALIYGITGDCFNMSELSTYFDMSPATGVKDIFTKPLNIEQILKIIEKDLYSK